MKPICIVIRKYENKFVDNVLEIIKLSEGCQINIVKERSVCDIDQRISQIDSIFFFDIEDFTRCNYVIISDFDVIVIDADIKVGLNWTKKMQQCAYQIGDIATVSPLFVLKDSTLLSKKINSNIQWEIEKPLGKCMFIKGKVISEMKKNIFEMETEFDLISEENCECISKLGYVYVLTGSVVCCGQYMNVEEKEISYVLPELYHELWAENDLKNILFYSFADFRENSGNNIGGTQLHLKDLVSKLKYKYNVIVAARNQEFLQVTRYTKNQEFSFCFYIGAPCFEMTFYSKTQRNLLVQIVNAFHIDIIHVQHLLGMSHDIFDIAEEMNIPLIMTVHDFYYICPLWRLIDFDKNICSPFATNGCNECLKKHKQYDENMNYILRWRDEYKDVLLKCSKLIFPSYSARDVFASFYPEARGKDVIIEHGIDSNIFGKLMECNNKGYIGEKIKIAFIGGISEIKGGELIYNMLIEGDTNIEWHLIGGNSYEPLCKIKKNNVKREGWYRREHLKQILNDRKIDIICILSIVSETYCYALSEAIACGIPVIATDIGALGSRVKEMQCGWLVPPNSTSREVIRLINNIKDTPGLYHSMWQHVQNIELKSIEMMAAEYESIYNKYEKHDKYGNFDIYEITNGKCENKYDCILSKSDKEMKDNNLRNEHENKANGIVYKICCKLLSIKQRIGL